MTIPFFLLREHNKQCPTFVQYPRTYITTYEAIIQKVFGNTTFDPYDWKEHVNAVERLSSLNHSISTVCYGLPKLTG